MYFYEEFHSNNNIYYFNHRDVSKERDIDKCFRSERKESTDIIKIIVRAACK